MKRVGINLAVALAAFSVGMVSWLLNPLGTKVFPSHEPVEITLTKYSDKLPSYLRGFGYIVTVRNRSNKTIRGFSLGHSCGCRSWDSDGNPYPPSITFSNPLPDRQVLRPGESLDFTMTFDATVPPRVWPDLVHFADGSNWGPNRGHKEGYVRE